MFRTFQCKEDYKGDTDENNCSTDYSQSENGNFVKILGQITGV